MSKWVGPRSKKAGRRKKGSKIRRALRRARMKL